MTSIGVLHNYVEDILDFSMLCTLGFFYEVTAMGVAHNWVEDILGSSILCYLGIVRSDCHGGALQLRGGHPGLQYSILFKYCTK